MVRILRYMFADIPVFLSELRCGFCRKRKRIVRGRPVSCRRYTDPPSAHPGAHRCSRLYLTRESSFRKVLLVFDSKVTFCRCSKQNDKYTTMAQILGFLFEIIMFEIDNLACCCIMKLKHERIFHYFSQSTTLWEIYDAGTFYSICILSCFIAGEIFSLQVHVKKEGCPCRASFTFRSG